MYFITVDDHIRSSVPAASASSWTSMHQRCVRCPARGAQCEVPSACCPVRLPSVGCPVPSQGSLLDPRSRAQKGRLVRKARPSQASGLPHFARAAFHSSFSSRFFSCLQVHSGCCFLYSKFLRRRVRGHFPGMVVYPSTHPPGRSLLWKCFPPPTSNKYWKRFLSSATDQKTMEDKGTDGRRRHGPEDQK